RRTAAARRATARGRECSARWPKAALLRRLMTIPASLKSHRDASVNTSTRENEGQEAARELWAALALATVKQQIYRLAAADSSKAPHAPRPTGDGKLTFGCASVDGLPDTDV